MGLRATLKLCLLFLGLIVIGLGYHLLFLLPRSLRRRAAVPLRGVFPWWLHRVLNVQIETVGDAALPADHGGVLLVANHGSFLDITVLASIFRCTFVSKAEVRSWPIIGSGIAALGGIFFDRDDLSARFEMVTGLGERIAPGEVATVFPQGVSDLQSRRHPFHRGVFKVLDFTPRLRLLPVTVHYLDGAGVEWGNEPFFDNVVKVCALPAVRVRVTVHPLMALSDFGDVSARKVAKAVEERVLGALDVPAGVVPERVPA